MATTLLDFAMGPLFAITFTFMVLGLLRLIVLHIAQVGESIRRLSNREFGLRGRLRELITWFVPVRHVYRRRPVISIVSFVFHVGLIAIPLLLLEHIALWTRVFGFGWPGFPPLLADVVTLIVIVSGLVLLGFRMVDEGGRSLSSPMDYLLLVVLLAAVTSGFMAMHPGVNPLSYRPMLLTHVLSSELAFVLIPTTKLAHCVLFPFDRVSSEVFWKMPVGAGDKVARELHGEEARV